MATKTHHWQYPPDRPWIEFVIIMSLLFACMFCMLKLTVRANEAKSAALLVAKEEKISRQQVAGLTKKYDNLLKRIATQVGIPNHEINEILAKDGNR